MKKHKRISRETNAAKLFADDLTHIKKIVQKNRYTDKRFESHSSAIRYYVELGIRAESSPDSAACDLDQKILGMSVTDELKAEVIRLRKDIENLSTNVTLFDNRQSAFFENSVGRISDVEAQVSSDIREISRRFLNDLESVSRRFDSDGKETGDMLRQLLVVRDRLNVFLCEHRDGDFGLFDERSQTEISGAEDFSGEIKEPKSGAFQSDLLHRLLRDFSDD